MKKLLIIMLSVGLFISVTFAAEKNININTLDPVMIVQKAVFTGVNKIIVGPEKSFIMSFTDYIAYDYDIVDPEPGIDVQCLQYRENLFLYSQDIKDNYNINSPPINYVNVNILMNTYDVMLC